MRSGSFYFNYQFNSNSTFDRSERYINQVTLILYFLDHSEGASDEPIKMGEVIFDRVFADYIIEDEKFTVFEIFDEDSDFYATDGFKITNGYEYHESLTKRWTDLGHRRNNFIYIYDFWLKPEFRGKKIMLKAILDLINQFRQGIDLIVILNKPLILSEILKSPIIFHYKDKMPEKKYSKVLSKQKMSKYLCGIGFEKIRGFRDLMFLNPNEFNDEVDTEYELDNRIEIP
ncbi:hypothetical protein SAMN04488104_10254 [Algoriphagus faecimaris]|uniref:Uncharacterized protein n=1 Tax=Algoriphagus faecimaris TaxID=686796 RepID=A0A1G6TZU8_9BACT|nr:hypothetical protein [Algoriphagus faecimaris]SDD33805.1 hypothetical protein SAMN04488104_10254 [Algoriphagus faecimaris]